MGGVEVCVCVPVYLWCGWGMRNVPRVCMVMSCVGLYGCCECELLLDCVVLNDSKSYMVHLVSHRKTCHRLLCVG